MGKIKYESKASSNKEAQNILTLGRTIALISAIVLIVSAFMKWAHILNEETYDYARGFEGDGKIIIILGLLAFIFLFIRKIPIWISLILGIIAITVGTVVLDSIKSAMESFADFGNNAGIYLAILASAGMIVGSMIEMIVGKRKKTFHLD